MKTHLRSAWIYRKLKIGKHIETIEEEFGTILQDLKNEYLIELESSSCIYQREYGTIEEICWHLVFSENH